MNKQKMIESIGATLSVVAGSVGADAALARTEISDFLVAIEPDVEQAAQDLAASDEETFENSLSSLYDATISRIAGMKGRFVAAHQAQVAAVVVAVVRTAVLLAATA